MDSHWKPLALVATLALSSCAIMESARDRVELTLMNKPVDHAIQVLGLPSEERTVVGRRMVIWQFGGARLDGQSCVLTTQVDKDEIIRGFTIQGARGVCYSWLGNLKG